MAKRKEKKPQKRIRPITIDWRGSLGNPDKQGKKLVNILDDELREMTDGMVKARRERYGKI